MDWEAFYNRFREPDFIPGYEIQNRLGGGAFGEVYKARKHSIGKAYAIKFLKIDDDAQREAVERELEQIRHFAALDHPNLVTIEDLGTVLGVPYLIMGYAGEDTLARVQKRERLPEERALLYFIQACRGVLALHDLRLVHFDLKPSNIFIKGEVARVGDYGLAKMMTDGRLTLSFGRGTPQYMAPEVLKNRADHRADVYSLGVILYESLAGRLPFQAAVPGTLALREDDQPPAFPEGFPERCRPVVVRSLRLSPEERYASVADMLSDLGVRARALDSVFLAGERARAAAPPVLARDVGPATPKPPSSDARQTARELTRGAVEVARGVIDGLRTAGERRAPAQSGVPRTADALAPADGSFAMQTLSEGTAARDVVPRPAAALATLSASGGAVASPVATIPVPPPASGGVLKTAWATVLLAFEVLVSLFRGVARSAGRTIAGANLGGAVGGARRTTGRLVSAMVRLALFLLLLALLGGLATLVAVFFVSQGRP
ncbi:MAG: serine/threonine-protein kinase [Planctomycetota bacterium]